LKYNYYIYIVKQLILQMMKTQILEPAILTASTFYWKPATSASSRRSNEVKNLNKVEEYLRSLGFETSIEGDYVNGTLVHLTLGNIKVLFHYSESCKNVYKTLSITRDGKNSNIKLLRKIAETLNELSE